MKCPACKAELIPGKPEQYETLSEHVELTWDDEEELDCPERPTLVCPRAAVNAYYCPMTGFWNPDGEYYGLIATVQKLKYHGAPKGSMWYRIYRQERLRTYRLWIWWNLLYLKVRIWKEKRFASTSG
jgi:hypothetical protein